MVFQSSDYDPSMCWVLGRYDSSIIPSYSTDSNESWTFEYMNGATDCGNPARTWMITFQCQKGVKYKTSTVTEPGTCLYDATIYTEYACSGWSTTTTTTTTTTTSTTSTSTTTATTGILTPSPTTAGTKKAFDFFGDLGLGVGITIIVVSVLCCIGWIIGGIMCYKQRMKRVSENHKYHSINHVDVTGGND